MIYPVFSREREQSDHDKAHRRRFTGDNYIRHLPGTRRTVRDPGRAQLRLHRRSRRRPPRDPCERCRRCAQKRATMCSGRLLLGPDDRWGEAGLNLVSQPAGKVPATAGVSCLVSALTTALTAEVRPRLRCENRHFRTRSECYDRAVEGAIFLMPWRSGLSAAITASWLGRLSLARIRTAIVSGKFSKSR